MVITTAAVPGKKSPVLVTAEMVAKMAPGSVIVDLAAERGGNCELTKAGQTVVEQRRDDPRARRICRPRPRSTPARCMRRTSSTFLLNLVKDKQVQINLEDEIIRDTLIGRDGQVVNPRIQQVAVTKTMPAARECAVSSPTGLRIARKQSRATYSTKQRTRSNHVV